MHFEQYATETDDAKFDFTESQWDGIVNAGNAAAGISIGANSIVLILHAFMTWYRPAIVNRLSLRMIVLSCIFNMIFCACQLVSDSIPSTSFSCRVLAYILIASDTMACMSLAMVGLNLVMIFVLKVSRSIKLELLYYLIISLSGIIVTVIPYRFGTVKGPKNQDNDATCWYHYYFDGRMNNIFNWMWYYGWLLFSLVFAALCAAISIRFVIKKQENAACTLDMHSRRNKPEANKFNTLKRYSNNNTDVFQKIARRCVCYPLIPFFSKSWGVGIEIAALKSAYIPYPIFVLDRIFSCLLGFMVSCVYFTDPAIGAVFYESKEALKKKYVYDYYCVRYRPGSDPSIQPKSQYPQVIKVVPNENIPHTTPVLSSQMHGPNFLDQEEEDVESRGQDISELRPPADTFIDPLDMSQLHPHVSSATPQSPTHKPEIPTVEVHKTHLHLKSSADSSAAAGVASSSSQQRHSTFDTRRYSVISVTSVGGKVYLPNEVILDNTATKGGKSKCLDIFKRKTNNVTTIPMRRVSNHLNKNIATHIYRQHHEGGYDTRHTETVEILVPFRFPKLAIFVHWTLVYVFKVTPMERKDSDAMADELTYDIKSARRNATDEEKTDGRVFHDFTDDSDTGLPITSPPLSTAPAHQSPNPAATTTASTGNSGLSKQTSKKLTLGSSQTSPLNVGHKPRSKSYTESSAQPGGSSTPTTSSKRKNELQRVSTINIPTLQRGGYKRQLTGTPPIRPIGYLERKSSTDTATTTNSTNKLASTLGLTRMWGRKASFQFNLGKFGGGGGSSSSHVAGGPTTTAPAKKSGLSTSTTLSVPTTAESSRNSTPVLTKDRAPTPEFGSTSSKKIKRDLESIDKQALRDDEQDFLKAAPKEQQQRSEPVAVPSGLAISSPFPMELSPRPISQYRRDSFKKRKIAGLHRGFEADTTSAQQGLSVSTSFPMRTAIKRVKSRSSTKSDKSKRFSFFAGDYPKEKYQQDEDDNRLTSLMELFDGVKNTLGDESEEEQGSPTADDILQPGYTTLTPTEEKTRPVSSVSQISKASSSTPMEKSKPLKEADGQEGFMEGFTTIDYISNWQDPSEAAAGGEDTRIVIYSEAWDPEEQFKVQAELAEDIAHI